MPTSNSPLENYRRKRRFGRTPEPEGDRRKSADAPIFIVQKHLASTLHYDFRIEVGGVLKSWAVPKGPSLNTRDKRLAVPTEDHPIEYASFEGIIPEGEYGAGAVLLWDSGTYRNIKPKDGTEEPIEQALAKGHINIRLEGHKLKGGFALIRTGTKADSRWLLIKMSDDEANPQTDLLIERPESVASGLTIEQINKGI